MFIRKMQMPQQGMPTAEEFALWGARELSFEELLAVNGGKREKKEKSSGKSTSSGSSGSSSSGGSSGSSSSRTSSRTGSSSKKSSKSKEKKKNAKAPSGSSAFDEKKSKPPVQSGTPSVNSPKAGESKKEEEKQSGSASYTVREGDTLNGIIRKQYPGASDEEVARRVKEAAANSGIENINLIRSGQKIVFEKPAPPSDRANEGEKTSPTQGGGSPRGRWGQPSSGGGVSGSTGGVSGNSSGGESSASGSSGGGNTDSGGSAWFNGRRSGGGDWQGGKNPRMPPDWGTKEKQHTEGRDAGTDFAMPQEKRGVKEKISGWFKENKTIVGKIADPVLERLGLEKKEYYFWKAAVGETADGEARGLYSSAGADLKTDDGQLNLFINVGGAEYTPTKTIFDGECLKVDFSGSMGTFQADLWGGVKDGRWGVGGSASLIKYSANVDVSVFERTLRIGAECGLGVWVEKSFVMGYSIPGKMFSQGVLAGASIYLRK